MRAKRYTDTQEKASQRFTPAPECHFSSLFKKMTASADKGIE
jgi:hypothetical protein